MFEHRITQPQLVYEALQAAGEPLTTRQISARLPSIAPTRVSTVLTQLQNMGLVRGSPKHWSIVC